MHREVRHAAWREGRDTLMQRIVRQSCHILYTLFNWACIIVYAFQIYLWIRHHAWTKIPSRVALPFVTEERLSVHPGSLSKAFHWLLNVELAYTLCALALILFGLRWLADKKKKQRTCDQHSN